MIPMLRRFSSMVGGLQWMPRRAAESSRPAGKHPGWFTVSCKNKLPPLTENASAGCVTYLAWLDCREVCQVRLSCRRHGRATNNYGLEQSSIASRGVHEASILL